jgi:hypothetical protein
MQENAKQNLEKENLLNEKLDSAIPKPDVIDQSSNDNKELEMAKKAKQDADKPPSNLGGNQANEKATGNLSDSYNDLGQEDSPPLGFFEKYVKPASKKFTDFTAGLIKDSRSLVDWFLGPSKGKPMNDPVSKFFSKLADWLVLNKTSKLIKDAIDDKRLKSNIVPDGHKGSNLQEDKQPAQDSRKFDPRLDFDSVAQEMGVGNNKDRQFNNANNELKESNGKNQLIADNKSSSSAQDPYQVDNANHDMQSENSPMKYKMNHGIRHNGVARAERLPMPYNSASSKPFYNHIQKPFGSSVKKEEANVLFDIDNDIGEINRLSEIKPIYDEKIDIELDNRSSNEHIIPALGKHTAKLKDSTKTQPKIGRH